MADEIVVDNKKYISSKRAAEISGYAQDYIGQLARSGQIDAQRVGGLWFISMDSLTSYKVKADTFKPQPPTAHPQKELESIVTLAHKKEKDALLAAVQTAAVGLYRSPADNAANPESLANLNYNGAGPYLKYTNEEGDLLPKLEQKEVASVGNVNQANFVPSHAHQIPIRVLRGNSLQITENTHIPSPIVGQHHTSPRNNRRSGLRLVLPATAIATIVIVLTVGYSWPGANAVYTRLNPLSNTAASGLLDGAFATITKIGDMIENIVAPEYIYKRAENNFSI
ncbi:MAG: hypothetical protein UY04_C0064G0003 [Parcubacteria group bacterium GW2011_GWA2_47_7]|nr:MAG: hypothetical protein UY04_C0064G0003 [Parcubacteria group bacterium GW2011_GWA2_47_7]